MGGLFGSCVSIWATKMGKYIFLFIIIIIQSHLKLSSATVCGNKMETFCNGKHRNCNDDNLNVCGSCKSGYYGSTSSNDSCTHDQCSVYYSCDDCVDREYDNCLWCDDAGGERCVNFDDFRSSCHVTSQECQPRRLDMLTFAATAAALTFLCACSMCMRRYRNAYGDDRYDGFDDDLRQPLRQEIRDTMLEMGAVPWTCPVCNFENSPKNKTCDMCGTENEGRRESRSVSTSSTSSISSSRDSRVPSSLLSMSISYSHTDGKDESDNGNGNGNQVLSNTKREKAFTIRQLNQRQKSARRRNRWTRERDDEGKLRWKQKGDKYVLLNEAGGGRKEEGGGSEEESKTSTTPTSSSSGRMRRRTRSRSRSSSGSRGREGSGDEGNKTGNNNEMRDTFNDSAMLSTSPGFVSEYLGERFTFVESSECLTDIDMENFEEIAAWPFREKWRWFLEEIGKMQKPWSDGHINCKIDRENMLEESLFAFQQLQSDQFHLMLRIEFEGEPAIDAGGLEREWFELITKELFSPELGLFSATSTEDVGYVIDPLSALNQPGGKHLEYLRFTGILFGKALMEQQVVPAHLSVPLLKHILGVPITFSDLEFIDAQLYTNLLWVRNNNNTVDLGLDFSVTQVKDGKVITHNLKPGGEDIKVTDENKEEYIFLLFRYRMLDSIQQQLFSFLTGMFEVIPRGFLAVFDYQELEMLLCGLPHIDVNDWKYYTVYEGNYRKKGENHRVIKWFWEVVEAFSEEDKARLLQFITGTSRVPAQGFKALQSNDGVAKKFTIRSMYTESDKSKVLPYAHTCFNRIDMPEYATREHLEDALNMVIHMEITGFTTE